MQNNSLVHLRRVFRAMELSTYLQ